MKKLQNCPQSGVDNRNHATLSKIGEDIRKVITLSKESMTLSKEIRDCPNQGHRLNALFRNNTMQISIFCDFFSKIVVA